MRRVLAFDPGHLTGIAFFDREGDWVVGMTVKPRAFDNPRFFPTLVKQLQPEVVLVERIPPVNPDPETLRLHGLITRWFEVAGFEVVQISPGKWKPMIKREAIPGTHMTDAALMARWYQISQKENPPIRRNKGD